MVQQVLEAQQVKLELKVLWDQLVPKVQLVKKVQPVKQVKLDPKVIKVIRAQPELQDTQVLKAQLAQLVIKERLARQELQASKVLKDQTEKQVSVVPQVLPAPLVPLAPQVKTVQLVQLVRKGQLGLKVQLDQQVMPVL